MKRTHKIFALLVAMIAFSNNLLAQSVTAKALEGTYVGALKSMKHGDIANYKVKVTAVNDSVIHVAPVSGTKSLAIDIPLVIDGEMVTLKIPGSPIPNGDYNVSKGRLMYATGEGGSFTNMEMFTGTKE